MNSLSVETELSKQQLKSMATKSKIFNAAKTILQQSGYEALSIKNICEEAGVSNGSFYHHFRTKDDLLSYYIEELPTVNPDLLETPATREEVAGTIIQVYLNYAKYCRELGVEFISGYYTPKNQALNPESRPERPYPIITVQAYLERAMASGVIPSGLDLEAVTTDIRMLVIGNAFEWSMRDGFPDLESNLIRSIGTYLRGLLGQHESGNESFQKPAEI